MAPRLRRYGTALAALTVVAAAAGLLVGESEVVRSAAWTAFGLAALLASLFAVRLLFRLARRLATKALWRVRHRMTALFFFVGVLPISSAALIAAAGLLVVLGPVTVYVSLTDLLHYTDRLRAAAHPLRLQIANSAPAERRRAASSFAARASADFPGLVVLTEFDGVVESHPRLELPRGIPTDAEASPLASIGGTIYLTAESGSAPAGGRVIVAVPFTPGLLTDLLPGLGVLQVPGGAAPVSLTATPSQQYALDLLVRWPVESLVHNWDTGETEQSIYVLQTRPSAVWERILSRQTQLTRSLLPFMAYTLLGFFAASLLVSILIAAWLARTLTRSVNDLYQGTRHVNRGDFRYRIPIRGTDQVSDLARSFNAMTASLERLVEESKRRQYLEAELEIAREVQSQLFPSGPPGVPGIEVLGVCRPASTVSGDFYDYVRLSGGRLAVCFGDVAGKGISAALVMASLHSILRTEAASLHFEDSASMQRSAARAVSRANSQLFEATSPEKFSTLFFGAYDAATGALAYTNAGHLPPVLLRNGSAQPLDIHGMIVGAFRFADYSAGTVQLRRGDLLVAFTDGLTEPENANGEEYGEERLLAAVRAAASKSAKQLIEHVMDEVTAWSGAAGQSDDMTMMVLRKV